MTKFTQKHHCCNFALKVIFGLRCDQNSPNKYRCCNAVLRVIFSHRCDQNSTKNIISIRDDVRSHLCDKKPLKHCCCNQKTPFLQSSGNKKRRCREVEAMALFVVCLWGMSFHIQLYLIIPNMTYYTHL